MTGTCQRNVAEGSGHSHKGGDQSCETTVLCVAMKPTHLPLEYTSLRINSDAAKQIVDSLELQIGDAANFFFFIQSQVGISPAFNGPGSLLQHLSSAAVL